MWNVSKKLERIENRIASASVAELRVESANVQKIITETWNDIEYAAALQSKIARLIDEQLAASFVEPRLLVHPTEWVKLPEDPVEPAQAAA